MLNGFNIDISWIFIDSLLPDIHDWRLYTGYAASISAGSNKERAWDDLIKSSQDKGKKQESKKNNKSRRDWR